MEKLILARHAESVYSVRGLVNGDASVAVGLTEVGEEQARELARLLADEPLDLCVTSALPRTGDTARLALDGRTIPAEAWADLDDPRAGAFEGRTLDEYRRWAWASGSAESAPGGGESRLAVISRYVRAYRVLLDRPERRILAVVHALVISYVLRALEGEPPAPRMDRPIPLAHPYTLSPAELEQALEVLEGWCARPTW